jgi:hypothetical protein
MKPRTNGSRRGILSFQGVATIVTLALLSDVWPIRNIQLGLGLKLGPTNLILLYLWPHLDHGFPVFLGLLRILAPYGKDERILITADLVSQQGHHLTKIPSHALVEINGDEAPDENTRILDQAFGFSSIHDNNNDNNNNKITTLGGG